jgi:PIN domain nuclease of toxin-antitoxin system
VAALLTEPDGAVSISAVNMAEVVDVLVRIVGRAVDDVTEKLDWLEAGGLDVVDVDAGIGRAAGILHARHHHRRNSPMSMADCVALATAVRLRQPVVTADVPLARVAALEGCDVVALPDSLGRQPA